MSRGRTVVRVRSSVPFFIVPARLADDRYVFAEPRDTEAEITRSLGCLIFGSGAALGTAVVVAFMLQTWDWRVLALIAAISVVMAASIGLQSRLKVMRPQWRELSIDLRTIGFEIATCTHHGRVPCDLGSVRALVGTIAPCLVPAGDVEADRQGWLCILGATTSKPEDGVVVACASSRVQAVTYARLVLAPMGVRIQESDRLFHVQAFGVSQGRTADELLRWITHCAACGYDVQACRGDRCPECGKPRAFVPPDTAPAQVSSR